MSIVRIGLSETKRFAEGYEAIFGQGRVKKEGLAKKAKTTKKKKTKKSK